MSLPDTETVLAIAMRDGEESELPRPYCDRPWHTQQHLDVSYCPDCLSHWWAIDGSEPFEPAMYWLAIIGRRAVDGATTGDLADKRKRRTA